MRVYAPENFVDVFPTVVEFAGGKLETVLNAPSTPPLPGRSFAAALAKAARARKSRRANNSARIERDGNRYRG